MIPLYGTASLRRIEQAHAEQALMERAGQSAARWAMSLRAQSRHPTAPVLVLAGGGNNGGDALIAAKLLLADDIPVHLVFAGDVDRLPPEAAAAWQSFLNAGGEAARTLPETPPTFSLILDGLFGVGFSRFASGIHAHLIACANQLAERDGCLLLALDCPSGLLSDSGVVLEPAIRASHTLSFLGGKPGLWTADGPDYCGEIRIDDLGLNLQGDFPADGLLIERRSFSHFLRPRAHNSHKGHFGSLGILGGGRSMVGAALLAGRAALKLGTGRVYLGLTDSDAPTVDPAQPELMLRRADMLLHVDLNVLACGPGLGRSNDALRLLEECLSLPCPLVLDADALNLVALHPGARSALLARQPNHTLLTPHPAEAARLLGIKASDIQKDRVGAARALAKNYHSTIILKGCGTIVCDESNNPYYINGSGNPGLASAGTGDVLTGIASALLAQGWPLDAAARAAVHLHGAAADRLIAQNIGPFGLTASEVLDSARILFNEWVRDNNH